MLSSNNPDNQTVLKEMIEIINSKNLNLRMNLKDFANFTVMKRKNEDKLVRKNEFVSKVSKFPVDTNKKKNQNQKNSSKSDPNEYDRFKPKESKVKENSNETSKNRFLLKD